MAGSQETLLNPEHGSRLQIDKLRQSTIRHDIFSDDESDEFTITVGGEKHGIFKVWSPHVIPSLDLRQPDSEIIRAEWAQHLASQPLAVYQAFEQWRSFSENADRRLQEIFDEREIPDDTDEAIAELILRLKTAFAYAAPFYNLEALVVDPRKEALDNPIDFLDQSAESGRLDAVAMLLPSALTNLVTADTLDWKQTDWQSIKDNLATIKAAYVVDNETFVARQYINILRIADMAGVQPEDVLFAANALQFIPDSVGGKKGDYQPDEALDMIERVLTAPTQKATTESVAKDLNALIRFLNWMPAVKSDENFKGRKWSYGAVCDTSDDLVALTTLTSDFSLNPTFAPEFRELIEPQLEHLDANSAKGRYMLQLFNDGLFSQAIQRIVNEKELGFNTYIDSLLAHRVRLETLDTIESHKSAALSGGKAQGIKRAIQIFGQEKVLTGSVISTESIAEWVMGIDGVSSLISVIQRSKDIVEKTELARQIVMSIQASDVPSWLIDKIIEVFKDKEKIVLRSSSFDEDVPIIGAAPGVYESVVNIQTNNRDAIEAGLKETVSSFFSDKALGYREFRGLRHHPLFGVLIQEYIKGTGGSVFIDKDAVSISVASQPELINVQDMAHATEAIKLSLNDSELPVSKLMSREQLQEIASMCRTAELVFGSSDMEFIVAPSGAIKLLQLRSLDHQTASNNSPEEYVEATNHLYVNDLDNFPNIAELKGTIAIHIGKAIDLDKFQGDFFRWIIRNNAKIICVILAEKIPPTCHFANIIQSLGMRLEMNEKNDAA